MKDVQNQKDLRNIPLNEVGIKNLRYPLAIKDSSGEWFTTHTTISATVGLPAEKRGTHMSRFVEIIQEYDRLNLKEIRGMLERMQTVLEAETAFLTINFDYFVKKKAPVSGKEAYLNVNVTVSASLENTDFRFVVTVQTPVTTLCPCSKEISDYSAHNQRALVTITTETQRFIPLEQYVAIAEAAASSPVYPLLKRPDEKYVTEYAYDHPKFVEDVCRDVKQQLDRIPGIQHYEIEAESLESIHNHSAYAKITGV
ncbi:MAG TPA: GTP cyclohydrolase FolE2, partial [Clostridiales bacterium]|nr:GTP cyclohydrolase FolE2 [Clostridiales bacterium]